MFGGYIDKKVKVILPSDINPNQESCQPSGLTIYKLNEDDLKRLGYTSNDKRKNKPLRFR